MIVMRAWSQRSDNARQSLSTERLQHTTLINTARLLPTTEYSHFSRCQFVAKVGKNEQNSDVISNNDFLFAAAFLLRFLRKMRLIARCNAGVIFPFAMRRTGVRPSSAPPFSFKYLQPTARLAVSYLGHNWGRPFLCYAFERLPPPDV